MQTPKKRKGKSETFLARKKFDTHRGKSRSIEILSGIHTKTIILESSSGCRNSVDTIIGRRLLVVKVGRRSTLGTLNFTLLQHHYYAYTNATVRNPWNEGILCKDIIKVYLVINTKTIQLMNISTTIFYVILCYVCY